MKNWDWKTIGGITAMLTLAVLLYSGIRADMRGIRADMRGFHEQTQAEMRELRTEMRAVNGALADIRERLSALEVRVGESSAFTSASPQSRTNISFRPLLDSSAGERLTRTVGPKKQQASPPPSRIDRLPPSPIRRASEVKATLFSAFFAAITESIPWVKMRQYCNLS